MLVKKSMLVNNFGMLVNNFGMLVNVEILMYVGETCWWKKFVCWWKKFRYVGEMIILLKNLHQHQGPKNQLMLVKECWWKSMLVKNFRILVKFPNPNPLTLIPNPKNFHEHPDFFANVHKLFANIIVFLHQHTLKIVTLTIQA